MVVPDDIFVAVQNGEVGALQEWINSGPPRTASGPLTAVSACVGEPVIWSLMARGTSFDPFYPLVQATEYKLKYS